MTPEFYSKLKSIDGFAKVAQKTKRVPTMTSVKDKATICKYLEQPLQNRERLIELSNLFEHKNGYYKRFLLYMANLPTYNTMIIPASLENPETLREGYTKANDLVGRLNLKSHLHHSSKQLSLLVCLYPYICNFIFIPLTATSNHI